MFKRYQKEPMSDEETIRQLFETLAIAKTEEMNFEQQRAALEAADSLFGSGAPAPCHEEVIKVRAHTAVVRIPRNAQRGRVLVYFHGGGFCIGSSKSERGLSLRLSDALRAPVVVSDYRLAPQHPYPAAHDDAVDAVKWCLTADAERLLGPVTSIVVGGTSAGANLAISAVVHLKDSSDIVFERVRAAFGITGWYDLTNSSPSQQQIAGEDPILNPSLTEAFASAYVRDEPRGHPRLSPLYADLAGLPPVRLDAAEIDTLRDDSVRLAEKLDVAGVNTELVEWKRMPHMFPYFEPMLKEAKDFIYSELPMWLSEAARWN
ncbi:MAG: alpha/beta hydrolase [Acidimicrobiia bacterium]